VAYAAKFYSSVNDYSADAADIAYFAKTLMQDVIETLQILGVIGIISVVVVIAILCSIDDGHGD
jgi:hypothetical protein